MHGVEKGLNELCGILKITECDIKKCTRHSHVMAVQNKPSFKTKGNSWQKKKGKAKDSIPKHKHVPKQKAGPVEDTECFFCHEHGHWKRNCSKYLASLKKNGSKSTSNSGTLVVNVVDIFLDDSYVNSWVFDTGSVAHICNSMQGLIRTREVLKGEVDFRVGNKARVAALFAGVMQLHLPSGFIMELNNCYYIPSMG